MKFYGFSADYLQRLTRGDPLVEDHFSAYFGELIFLKLRNRLRSHELIEDVRQETLLRVIRILRNGPGVEQPERFGAYVNSVCNNVLRELLRDEHRHNRINEESEGPANSRIDLDQPLVTEERKRLIRSILRELPSRDRQVLEMLFLEELPSQEVCHRLGVDAGYLRVLVHRAKSRFKSKISRAGSAGH